MNVSGRIAGKLQGCGLPADALGDCARVTILGRSEATIEGQHGVIELSSSRIRLRTGDWTVVPRVLDEIAAPCLRRMLTVHSPILLSGLTAQMLTCTAFREAVVACLTSPHPVIVACADDAEELLRALTPAETQLWTPVPQSADARAALLEELVTEAALRL